MLDLTGVQALERPELRHLVVQSARSIENALTLAEAHAVLLRLNWPGRTLGDETDGLLGLDADGGIRSANSAARQLLPQLNQSVLEGWHCRDLFALPFEKLFDAARRDGPPMEVPLWSGLRLQLLARRQPSHAPARNSALMQAGAARPSMPLKDVETALIQKAVRDARGNVAQAARLLGISRATVYRKLGQGTKSG
jgi:transcriptional regulator of acetoin/glycerol metabolism